MRELDIAEELRKLIYCRIAAILHLGNIEFTPNEHGYAEIPFSSQNSLNIAAKLLDVCPKRWVLVSELRVRRYASSPLYSCHCDGTKL